MSIIVTQLFNGVSLGSILLLIALGLAITFGLMNIINMAHGELIMMGAYTTYVLQQVFIQYLPKAAFGYYFILAIPLSFLVAALLGLLMEKTVVRFLYERPLDSLLATWGVSLILQQVARSIFGAPNVAVVAPEWLNGGLTLTGMTFPYKRLFIVALVLLCIFLLFLYLYKTPSGRRMKAVTLNRDMASCLGVSTRRVDSTAFAIGSGFAGIAGCSLTLIGSIGPTLGSSYIVDAFMIVILGGIGKLKGTIFAALMLGVLSTFVELSTSATFAKVIVFALIIIFLQWKPTGLVGAKVRALD
ncbi:urea ABC transporter permease subunit UrtB [Metabacillus bambusae]|uniref:Urea ABC transporter permease subunit UrtB n=1 Tax=Metabacillus bambusae TaxID=2795218 RepID=A0ABS3N7W2_9BACI|nr:urea ABC transporter permease subunit UrtB [Metabacillus bambusae]MBO1514380.1 urea ABC transporter permease subunit UrtB [Metabacillus bambusae]